MKNVFNKIPTNVIRAVIAVVVFQVSLLVFISLFASIKTLLLTVLLVSVCAVCWNQFRSVITIRMKK